MCICKCVAKHGTHNALTIYGHCCMTEQPGGFSTREKIEDAQITCSFNLMTYSLLLWTFMDLIYKNYNFLDCDWFKKLLFSTNSLAKLLSDSLLLDSLLSYSSISQSHSKL